LKSGRLYSCHILIFVGKAVRLFAPLSFSSRDLGPIYCDINHQKVMDDQLFVGSYQHVSDKGRYDKVENWKTQLLLPVRAKSFIKSERKLFKHLNKLLKKSRSRRISLSNPRSIKIKLRFYMILFILLICIEIPLDGENRLLFSCRDIAPTSPEALVLQSWIRWTF
jgi:hypothetical protein